MELFNEFRNQSVTAFIKLVERLANGEILKEFQFEAEYYKLAEDPQRVTEVFYKKVIQNEKLMIFDFSDPNQVRLDEGVSLNNDAHIASILLKIEEQWLHAALNDELSALFLDKDEIMKLDINTSEYYKYIDDNWRERKGISEDMIRNFRTILEAINENKSISFEFMQKNTLTQATTIPVKLEYDERKNCIHMISYNSAEPEKMRFKKMDLSKISNIRILENDLLQENIPDINQEMQKKADKEPLEFTVTDYKNRNAINRALLAFSVYDHVVEPINEKKAIFTIMYYKMDRDLLMKEILAFGADIQITSPKYMVDKIKKILTERT